VRFFDGSSALVVSNEVAVPEPTSIAIALGALAFALATRIRKPLTKDARTAFLSICRWGQASESRLQLRMKPSITK
jgi:hypothetical protein